MSYNLAVAVLPAEDGYITVIDSERYTGSEALAEHLASKLKTAVLHWTASGATNYGDATWFGERPKKVRRPPKDVDHMEIVGYLGSLEVPFMLSSFDDLKELPRDTCIMGFRKVSFEAYDGEAEDDVEDDGVASAAQAAAWRDDGIAEGLKIWDRIASSRTLTGAERARGFYHDAPNFSVGQDEGLLGLVDNLAEVDPARADAMTRQVLDWKTGERPPTGTKATADFWASCARQALLRNDLAGCEFALSRYALFRPTILVGIYSTLYKYPPDVLVDWLRAAGRTEDATAAATARKMLARRPARPTAKQLSALATTWELLVGWLDRVPRKELELGALTEQVEAAREFGDASAAWLAALEKDIAARKAHRG